MPVQIAYESPIGNARIATLSSRKLDTIDTTITAEGTSFVNPSEYFSAITQIISSTPAAKRQIQLIINPSISAGRGRGVNKKAIFPDNAILILNLKIRRLIIEF